MPVPPKVLNPSFENWTAGNPDSWSLSGAGAGNDEDTTKFYDGVASNKLSAQGGGNAVADATQDFQVKGFRDQNFQLKAYANGRAPESGHSSGAVMFVQASDPLTTLQSTDNSNQANVWALLEFVLTIPINSNVLTIRLRDDKRSTEGFGPQYINFDTVVLQYLGYTAKRTLNTIRTLSEISGLGSQALKRVLV